MSNLPSGWRKKSSGTGNEILFKLYKTGTIAVTFQLFNRISQIIVESELRDHISLSLSNDFLSVTLNDLGSEKLTNDYVVLAKTIDAAL